MNEQLGSDILMAFIQGKEDGFNAIYNLYYREIHYFTYKLTLNREEAEDITIHTFMKLFKMHDRFTTYTNIRAFLYVTARNNSLDFLKSATRKRMISKDFSVAEADALTDDMEDSTTQNEVIEANVLQAIYNAVETLPDQCQRIFKLLFYEGKKPADIALQLGITPETVRSQKRNALDLLRIRLADNQLVVAWLLYLGTLEYGHVLQQTVQAL